MKDFLKSINWKIVIAAVAVAALISWLFIYNGKEKVKSLFAKGDGSTQLQGDGNQTIVTVNSAGGNATSSATSSATAQVWGFPIGWGTGATDNPSNEVLELQRAMNYYLRDDIAEDGAWGKNTNTALKKLRDDSTRSATPTSGAAKYVAQGLGIIGVEVPAQGQFKNIIPAGDRPMLTQVDYDNIIGTWRNDKSARTNENIC